MIALAKNRRGGSGVAAGRDVNVDELAELVDGAVHVTPFPETFHTGLVDVPAVTDTVPARPGGVDQQRREPLHPTVDCDVVDLGTAFGQQLLDVSVREAEA